MFDKVNIEDFLLAKLGECENWLNGKDEALAQLEDAQAKYEEAKKNVEDYTEDNIAQVESYKKYVEEKLIALGVLKVKEEVVEEKIDDIAEIAEVQPIEQEVIESVFAPEER